MSRSDGDELVCACCLLPADGVRRTALGEWLQENGDEGLAAGLSVGLIRETRDLADKLGELPSVRLLFATWVTSRLKVEEPSPAPQPAVRPRPNNEDESPWTQRDRRRWPFRDDVRWATPSHPSGGDDA